MGRRRDAFIIVDNGAAERDTEVPFGDIVKAANEICASEIVLPDIMRDPDASCYATFKGMDLVPERWRRMVVPQADTGWDEFERSFLWLSINVPFASIGIGKHLERLPGGRAAALSILDRLGATRRWPIHLLGCWANPLDEMDRALAVLPNVRGMDSGAPIAYAAKLKQLDDPERESLDWHMLPLRGPHASYAYENLRLLENVCHGES
jgi:hypothetical protein